MRGKSNFYKHLVRIFWLSLIVGTVGIWYYVDRSIPDRVSVTEHDQEEFTFSLPWRATVYSESEEVALGNKSNIPDHHKQQRAIFHVCRKERQLSAGPEIIWCDPV